MILVTVGTQKFQLNRLFEELDKLIDQGKITEEIIAQAGYSNYFAKNFKTRDLIEISEMEQLIKEANMIITHAGTSSIILGLKNKKKVIVVPRRKEFEEHVDDHQIEIAQMFYELGFIEIVDDITQLAEKINLSKTKKYKEYESEQSLLLSAIEGYIHQIKMQVNLSRVGE
ncbi:PssE/Cps14G family polysaccharide biosynthesis glycosyltransferase [Paenibacillus humicola]|uniref:PssE/Cps14G family polysaccharide biosynthesis glycosyltransferase n=1 Tax=Paenibacillus humicola TaxID=3110540 RepID=UPI00237BA74D|nr:PssE/Cps14G family polysaccharide biosynthesis glycosyltransferase [Paenibacillus humicola]